MVYLAISIKIDPQKGRGEYETYIRLVKPIVEQHGGRYLIRSERISALNEDWSPDRFILIRFETREQLERCFDSMGYRAIAAKRTHSVDSKAIIVEEMEYENL